jgi:hypothetical protein
MVTVLLVVASETRDIFAKLKPGSLETVKDITYLPESIGGQMK